MGKYICVSCGVQLSERQLPLEVCPICKEERQYVNPDGQQWTTLENLKEEGYTNVFVNEEDHLIGIYTTPSFAIGQRALLIQTDYGNVLWDCISYLDDETIEKVNALGGIDAIVISHPHYYSAMNEWAEAFQCPIYLHIKDKEWVMNASQHISFWSGEQLTINPDVKVIHTGGHFEGSCVLHWIKGAQGKGVLLTGDTIYVVADRKWVSFMYSYPNLIPLSANKISHILNEVELLSFDRLYGVWADRRMDTNAKQSVIRSAERYIKALQS